MHELASDQPASTLPHDRGTRTSVLDLNAALETSASAAEQTPAWSRQAGPVHCTRGQRAAMAKRQLPAAPGAVSLRNSLLPVTTERAAGRLSLSATLLLARLDREDLELFRTLGCILPARTD